VAQRLRELKPEDFETSHGMSELEEIVQELKEDPNPGSAIVPLFDVLERLDGADLGAPGPIVHFHEKTGGYEDELRRSLKRHPTDLTLWMANRIANDPSLGSARESWLAEIRQVAERPDVRADVRAAAADFLVPD
jgi:hypothetical protein